MQGKHINEQMRLFYALSEMGQAMVLIIMDQLRTSGMREEAARIAALSEVYRIAEN